MISMAHRRVRIDLTPWAGSAVQVELWFDTFFAPTLASEGVFVDNVTYETLCHDPATLDCIGDPDCPRDADECTEEVCAEGYTCSATARNALGCPD